MTYNITIRPLEKEAVIPYDLLLLADEELQAIDRYIHQSVIYIAETGGMPVGLYALYPVSADIAEIKAIAVRPAYQNKGIGKQLLRDAAIRAKDKGYCQLIIGTPDIARKQLDLYQKAGFEWYAIKKNFFTDHYSAAIYEDGIQLKDMAMLKKILY